MSEFHRIVPVHLDVVINTHVRILMLIPLLRIEKADSCGVLVVVVRCQRLLVAMGFDQNYGCIYCPISFDCL
jgi:hypothetical protein